MAEEDPVQRLRDSRPPTTDATTYLTIIDMSLKPSTASAVLPALHDILQDAELTSEIGWDLVDILIPFDGSESCLDAVARLGNPREVILKVLEALEKTADGEEEKASRQFVTLCNMLGVLHKRLKVKAPSRFLQTTLGTVHRTYKASSVEATTAVVALVRSLSGQKRPPLPTRKSSTVIAALPTRRETAPDPEAADLDADDGKVSHKLLQCFITCCIESYVNANQLEWAARLLEYTYPEKIVPRRGTVMKAYNEVDELNERDDLIGQLAGLADDLGLNKLTAEEATAALASPATVNPLEDEGNPLSKGGYVCLLAYWMFSSDIFEAHHAIPANIFIFPTLHTLLGSLLEDPEAAIKTSPGTVESCIVIALWLHTHELIAAPSSAPEFMPLHHLLTLIAVFHSNIRVRNAATATAGYVLHAASEEDRLAILEDLTENCMFSTLQACAVTWLKDEILAASPESRFASQDCLETLQYTLFPDLTTLSTDDTDALLEFWAEGSPYHLQVANFALFLLSSEKYKHLAPAGMAAAIEHRYVEPLLAVVDKLEKAFSEEKEQGEMVMRLSVLKDVLGRIPLQ